MLSIASRLKKGDREAHAWCSDGIVKKTTLKKKREDGKTTCVQLERCPSMLPLAEEWWATAEIDAGIPWPFLQEGCGPPQDLVRGSSTVFPEKNTLVNSGLGKCPYFA